MSIYLFVQLFVIAGVLVYLIYHGIDIRFQYRTKTDVKSVEQIEYPDEIQDKDRKDQPTIDNLAQSIQEILGGDFNE